MHDKTMDELRALALGTTHDAKGAAQEIALRLAPAFQGRSTGQARMIGGVLFLCFREGVERYRWRDLVGGAVVARNYQRSTFNASIPDLAVRGGQRSVTLRARSMESAMETAVRCMAVRA